jgi:NAD(P)-dependent dehydrogenase (short-subunit alcohol dehydrogenase family)
VIVKKFAAEGLLYSLIDAMTPRSRLVAEVETAGRRHLALSRDARQDRGIAGFLRNTDQRAPLEVCIFNVGANVNFPLLETTERVFRKVWETACLFGF